MYSAYREVSFSSSDEDTSASGQQQQGDRYRPSLLLAQRRAIDLTWSYRRTLGAQTTTDHLTSLIVPTCRRRAWTLGPKLHFLRLVVNGFAVQRASATNKQQVEVQ